METGIWKLGIGRNWNMEDGETGEWDNGWKEWRK
jgi:hypothetical protein